MRPSDEIRDLVDNYPEYMYLLFRRGYLLTDAEETDLSAYPFFNEWNRQSLGKLFGRELQLIAHPDQSVTIAQAGDTCMALIGHAYNPFTMEVSEAKLLEELAGAWSIGRTDFLQQLNELTGTFLLVARSGDSLFAVQDASGLKSCYFGTVSDRVYISSHPQLVADLRSLNMDPFIERLVKTRMYNVGNRYLPGNMSPFSELRRLGGNTYLELEGGKFQVNRFFPVEQVSPLDSAQAVNNTLTKLGDVLSKSLDAIAMKWDKPAISLTGGTDSKTTLAAAAPLYDKFSYFSFESKPTEKIDAEAARRITEALDLPHTVYSIPCANEEIVDYDSRRKLIDHNSNYFKNMADNEIRKMITLENLDDFDVEVKSWSSEIVRVFMERKYNVSFPTHLTPRHFSIFQTRFFGAPRLLRKTDKIYKEFINEIRFDQASDLYEATDLYYWEVRLGSWGSSVVSALDYCHEVTVPYNNRRFLEMFMSLPREMRKNDEAHSAIVRLKEPRISATKEDVKNQYFHSYRQILEKLYYKYRVGTYYLTRRIRRSVND